MKINVAILILFIYWKIDVASDKEKNSNKVSLAQERDHCRNIVFTACQKATISFLLFSFYVLLCTVCISPQVE